MSTVTEEIQKIFDKAPAHSPLRKLEVQELFKLFAAEADETATIVDTNELEMGTVENGLAILQSDMKKLNDRVELLEIKINHKEMKI